MKLIIVSLFIIIGNQHCIQGRSVRDFLENRNAMLQQELEMMFGDDVVLSPREEFVNKILMDAKNKEHAEGFHDLFKFNPAHHFVLRKYLIKNSEIFKIIKKMPKGALLHVHDAGMMGREYLRNLTYLPNLYMCYTNEDLNFMFSKNIPTHIDCEWELVEDARKKQACIEGFDKDLTQKFTMEVDYASLLDINNYQTWLKFEKIFVTIGPLLSYKPVAEKFYYDVLKYYLEDGIFYVEMRTTLTNLYDLDGNVYDEIESAKVIIESINNFKKDYPNSYGMNIIYAPVRNVRNDVVKNYIEITKQLKILLGDSFCGFDLVGQEDLGRPLIEFIAELSEVPEDINLFYHAGETNWYGTSTDYNLIDAVLLGTKRLGHAYALNKHPAICKYVKKHDIAVELNPISNQVLGYVKDLRNHPASSLIADNYPMVVSSDAPGLWGALPLSHDLYEAFMGIASKETDLKFLKKLCLNSITYSSLSPDLKERATADYLKKWDEFILEIENIYLNGTCSTNNNDCS